MANSFRGMFTRAIQPPDDVTPNPNPPGSVPPGTVGYGTPDNVPGDPDGLVVEDIDNPGWWPPRITPSAWSGWPAEWYPPQWSSGVTQRLTDTAWMCIDLQSSALATMPPYLVGASPSLPADWLYNPNPDLYTCWEEFARQMWWDFYLGEVFIQVTARYSSGKPARFYVVPPFTVQVEIEQGQRSYKVGSERVPREDMLHVRYQSTVADARGHGPLEVGGYRMVAAEMLTRYGTKLAAGGGIPAGILTNPQVDLNGKQAAQLKQQWMDARASGLGEPAVLTGGVEWTPTQVNPTEMALVDLLEFNEARIAMLLGVDPYMVGLPSRGDSMTYSNVSQLYDRHWRGHLSPKAQTVMSALTQWLLPRGTRLEVNRDAYVEPDPLTRAQTDQIYNGIRDESGNPVLTVQEIRVKERFDNSSPEDLAAGVLR